MPNASLPLKKAVRCPADCNYCLASDTTACISGVVTGTDIYQDRGYICSAAIHAGIIDKSEGGVVYVAAVSCPQTYDGSTQNDLESSTAAQVAGTGAFTFISGKIV